MSSLMHGPEELTASSNIPEFVPHGEQVTAQPQVSHHQQPQLVQLPSLPPCRGSQYLCYSPQPENQPGLCPALRELLYGHTGLQSCQASNPRSFSSQCYKHLGQKLWPGSCSVPTIIATHVHPPALTGGCSGQKGSLSSFLLPPGAHSGCNPAEAGGQVS